VHRSRSSLVGSSERTVTGKVLRTIVIHVFCLLFVALPVPANGDVAFAQRVVDSSLDRITGTGTVLCIFRVSVRSP